MSSESPPAGKPVFKRKKVAKKDKKRSLDWGDEPDELVAADPLPKTETKPTLALRYLKYKKLQAPEEDTSYKVLDMPAATFDLKQLFFRDLEPEKPDYAHEYGDDVEEMPQQPEFAEDDDFMATDVIQDVDLGRLGSENDYDLEVQSLSGDELEKPSVSLVLAILEKLSISVANAAELRAQKVQNIADMELRLAELRQQRAVVVGSLSV